MVTSEDNELVFGDLEIYAPNGSRYIYTVTEVKEDEDGQQGFLYGFTTSAGPGKLDADDLLLKEATSVGNLIPIQSADAETQNFQESDGSVPAQPLGPAYSDWATFKNVPAQEYITIEGTKEWTDFHDAFGVRPDDIELSVDRMAQPQNGQGNGIPWESVKCKITWTKDVDGNSDLWSYKIEAIDGQQLEMYAPNGMPWIYRVTEKTLSSSDELKLVYSGNPGTVSKQADQAVATEPDSSIPVLKMDALKNSTQASVQYKKVWIDESGNAITEDFLNQKLTVDFEIQVRTRASATESGTGEWYEASAFFTKRLEDTVYDQIFKGTDFTPQLTGKLGDSTWNTTQTVNGLPKAVMRSWLEDSGGTEDTSGAESSDPTQTLEERVEALDLIFLEYRVVETSVTVEGSPVQTITIQNDGDIYTVGSKDTGLVKESTFKIDNDGVSVTTNKLGLVSITITKQWMDGDNQYNTRPAAGGNQYDWKVDFVVQVKTGDTWKVYMDDEKPLIKTIYGDNEDVDGNAVNDGSITISGLPRAHTARGNFSRIILPAMESMRMKLSRITRHSMRAFITPRTKMMSLLMSRPPRTPW